MAHHTLVVGGFRDKVDAAVDLVRANGRTIVFTRTREGAVELAEALSERGVEAVDLHGDLSQRVRERNLHRFSSRLGPGRRRHRRRRARHPRRPRRPRGPLRPAVGRQVLPAPLGPYGARRPGRLRGHHLDPEVRAVGRPDAEDRRGRGPPPRPPHRPQADDGRGAGRSPAVRPRPASRRPRPAGPAATRGVRAPGATRAGGYRSGRHSRGYASRGAKSGGSYKPRGQRPA